jgi:hypothetical protein
MCSKQSQAGCGRSSTVGGFTYKWCSYTVHTSAQVPWQMTSMRAFQEGSCEEIHPLPEQYHRAKCPRVYTVRVQQNVDPVMAL